MRLLLEVVCFLITEVINYVSFNVCRGFLLRVCREHQLVWEVYALKPWVFSALIL